MPVIFYYFGKKIRAKSKFAPAPDIAQDKARDEEARLQNEHGNQTDVSGESESPLDREKEKKDE